jgi:hypothetical protein
MYLTSSIVTAITTDRIREAEAAHLANRSHAPAKPQRSRRLRSLATRIAAPGLR